MPCNHHNCSDHQHHNSCSGGCCGGGCSNEITLTPAEAEILMSFGQIPFQPVTRFVMRSSQSSHLESVALAPVSLQAETDSMEKAKETGKLLDALAHKHLISIDYDQPLEGGDYSLYEQSQLFAYFQETVEMGKGRPGFLFDTAALDLGSIALTALGQDAVEQLEIES